MNADAAFIIASKNHRICQDYAVAHKDGQYIIVSDGCSSSPDTDIGARLLVKLFAKRIENNLACPYEAIKDSHNVAKMLSLSDYSTDATLLVAYQDDLTDKPCIKANIYGDGVIATIDKENTLIAYYVEYPSGYPQYLSYSLDLQRERSFIETLKNNQPKLSKWTIKENAFQKEWDFDLTIDQCFKFPTEEYSLVALFSDGVAAFTDAKLEGIPWQDIVYKMMDLGTARKGQFVQRQMNWMVKEMSKNKWTSGDDFSMAAINME